MSQSVAKLGDAVSASDKRKLKNKSPKSCIKTEPVYIRKLVESAGNQDRAGNLIGYTGTGVSQALQDPEGARLSMELAARFIYERDFSPKKAEPKTITAVIQHDPNSMRFITEMVNNTGGKITILE